MTHLTTLRVSAVALLLLSAACGDDDDDDDIVAIDAATGNPDAAADTPDAAPGTPDAAAGIDGGGTDAGGTDAGGTDGGATDAGAGPDASGIDGGVSICSAPVDLFPTPVTAATSPFPSIDDDILEVSFGMGFTFDFYAATYTSVFLNTNGGLTFGAGDTNYDVAASAVTAPGIAVFWGDMDAAEHGADTRANQMTYTDCDDKFVVTYTQYQDNDDATWNNTATLTLFPTGAFEVVYGDVLSQDIMVGVFDGTHTADTIGAVAATIDYRSMGTGVILFDAFETGGTRHTAELNGQTINYTVP